jgi:hypothetical protein
MGAFDKIPAGSPVTKFSITAYNRMLDMLQWWMANQNGIGGGGRAIDNNNNIFDIQNTTGSKREWLDVLGIDDVLYDATDDEDRFKRKPVFVGVSPTVADHAGKWGVLLGPVANDGIAKIALSGVVPVRVYVTATTDKFVDVSASHTVSGETVYVATGASGAQILWLATGSAGTIQWAVVSLGGGGGTSAIYGKLDADMLASSPSGTVSIYTGTLGSETDSGENWTNVGASASWIGTGKKIAANSMVIAIQVQGGNKYLITAPCPVTA